MLLCRLTHRVAFVALVSIGGASACSASGDATNPGQSSVATTATGTVTSGSGGAASSGGNGGTGGAASTTTSSGQGGQGGAATQPKPECTDPSQCKLVNDCCACASVSAAVKPPKCGIDACLIATCESLGEIAPEPACSAGRCTMFDCDATKVMCKKATPNCPAGQVPLVEGECWGGCVPIQQCSNIDDCAKCNLETQVCVTEVFKGGPKRHCVDVAPGCNGKPSCECMGQSVCTEPFDTCSNDNGAIICGCTKC